MARKIPLNLKIFTGSLLLSLPFWWEINVFQKNLEDFLYQVETRNDAAILLAQLAQNTAENTPKQMPVRNWQVEYFKTEAESGISLFIDAEGRQKILFVKSAAEKLPIASLTKLMTADVILENYDLSKMVEISKKAVKEEGSAGDFRIGESFRMGDLIYPLIIESSNDAAVALSQAVGEDQMINLMNAKAREIKMDDTLFVDPAGLDPDEQNGSINHSTAEDLVRLAVYLLQKNSEIPQISVLTEHNLYSPDGVFHHKIKNTNLLLPEFPDALLSKTGWTPQAEGCLLFVTKAPNDRGLIVNVILHSPDRFGDMEKLIKWIGNAYRW
jgi:D-alanyl-D-alanine carboxypeptidase